MLGLRDYVNKPVSRRAARASGGIDSALTLAVAVERSARRPGSVLFASRRDSRPSTPGRCRGERGGWACSSIRFRSSRSSKPWNVRWRRPSPAAIATSPKRTFSPRARVCCSGRLETSSARCCSRPATSPRCRSARHAVRRHARWLLGAEDLYKTEVYALAAWRNRCVPDGALARQGSHPESVMNKAPTAEHLAESERSGLAARYADLDAMLTRLV